MNKDYRITLWGSEGTIYSYLLEDCSPPHFEIGEFYFPFVEKDNSDDLDYDALVLYNMWTSRASSKDSRLIDDIFGVDEEIMRIDIEDKEKEGDIIMDELSIGLDELKARKIKNKPIRGKTEHKIILDDQDFGL